MLKLHQGGDYKRHHSCDGDEVTGMMGWLRTRHHQDSEDDECPTTTTATATSTNNKDTSAPSSPTGSATLTGSRAAMGRLKSRLFETRIAAHMRQAHLTLADSIKQAGWAVEHKVSEVSRRGWSEATRAWSSGGSGSGTLALPGSSGGGGPHERSSLLLGPRDGYQRLDNVRNDGWGDDSWTSDWGGGNNSNNASPTHNSLHSPEPSPNARMTKKNSSNSNSGKNKGFIKNKESVAEQELLVDVGGSNGNSKGHTWDNWDDDWEKVDQH